MTTVSRFAKSALLVLLTATLTTAAYARGGGSGGSSGSHMQVHSDARVVAGQGNQTVHNGGTAYHGHCPTCAWHKVVHIPTAPQGAAQ